jgi:peroxiredoxin
MKRIYKLTLGIILLLNISAFAQSGGYEIGSRVTDFKLKNVDGNFISLSDQSENKGYIIVFTCNTCPWARAYEQRIIDLHGKYADKGYPVVAIQPNDPGISSGDSFEEMQKRAKEKNYPYPYVLDDKQEMALAFGATKTPDVFIVEKGNGGYYLKYKGTIDDNPRDGSKAESKYVENAVDQLLAGKEVEKNSTKGIGCSIKWSSSSKARMGKS